MLVLIIIQWLVVLYYVHWHIGGCYQHQLIRWHEAYLHNWLIKSCIFLQYFLLSYCVIETQFEFYWFELVGRLTLLVVQVWGQQVVVKWAHCHQKLFCVRARVQVVGPCWVELLVEYLEAVSRVNYVVFVCSVYAHNLLVQRTFYRAC